MFWKICGQKGNVLCLNSVLLHLSANRDVITAIP